MTPFDTLTILSIIPAGFARNLRAVMAQVLLAGLGVLVVARPSVIFRQAIMGNIVNPKVVLAFLPQFGDPSRPMSPQFRPLGLACSLGRRMVNGIFAGLAIRPALMQRG